MKRSKMENIICNWLLENASETYEQQSSYGRRIDAQDLLKTIEENGMQPPLDKITQIDAVDRWGIGTGEKIRIVISEWEHENE